MIGSKAFSSSWPASTAMVTVRSFPTTKKATWFTTSGMTGFTLPGMIDEPACLAGSLKSEIPVVGPEDRSLRSFATFERLAAKVLRTEDANKNPSRFWVESIKSSACFKSSPVISLKTLSIFSTKSVSYTHLTLPTILRSCRSRWSPYH